MFLNLTSLEKNETIYPAKAQTIRSIKIKRSIVIMAYNFNFQM